MKVLFLDIDGVMNNPGCYKGHSGAYAPPVPAAVTALNHITEATEARIVISSTWRIGLKLGELRSIVLGWGVTGQLIDKTPTTVFTRVGGLIQPSRPRGQEIRSWLDGSRSTSAGFRAEVEVFVILDDDCDMHPVSDRLVQTNGAVGLTMADADRAIALLRPFATPSRD